MALRRIYTFDETRGLSVKRVTPSHAAPHDSVLAPLALSNWQLAALYVIELEESATTSEIGFALVMDRPTVADVLRPLGHRKVIKSLPLRGGRKGAVALTESGRTLLARGLELWRTAQAVGEGPGEADGTDETLAEDITGRTEIAPRNFV